MPTALPISRLLSSPRRKVAASSPWPMALMATLAKDASMIAWPADSASKLLGVSLNRLSAPVTWRSTSSRNPMAPRTGVSASSRAASLGHNDGVVKSGSICAVSSSMASMQGPSPLLRSRSSIRCAMRSLAPTVTYRPSRRTSRLAWSQPETTRVAATQMAAYTSAESEPW